MCGCFHNSFFTICFSSFIVSILYLYFELIPCCLKPILYFLYPKQSFYLFKLYTCVFSQISFYLYLVAHRCALLSFDVAKVVLFAHTYKCFHCFFIILSYLLIYVNVSVVCEHIEGCRSGAGGGVCPMKKGAPWPRCRGQGAPVWCVALYKIGVMCLGSAWPTAICRRPSRPTG